MSIGRGWRVAGGRRSRVGDGVRGDAQRRRRDRHQHGRGSCDPRCDRRAAGRHSCGVVAGRGHALSSAPTRSAASPSRCASSMLRRRERLVSSSAPPQGTSPRPAESATRGAPAMTASRFWLRPGRRGRIHQPTRFEAAPKRAPRGASRLLHPLSYRWKSCNGCSTRAAENARARRPPRPRRRRTSR